jgi:hypothetical protein
VPFASCILPLISSFVLWFISFLLIGFDVMSISDSTRHSERPSGSGRGDSSDSRSALVQSKLGNNKDHGPLSTPSLEL